MKSIQPYPGITLEFEESRHRFLVNGDSTVSVTSVTGIIDKSRPLIYWAVGLAREFLLGINGRNITSDDVEEACKQHTIQKEKAASIGDIVHEFAEHFSLGLKPEIPENEKARNGALAFLKWIDQEKMKLQNPEQLVYSKKYDYAGIADAEAKRDGKLFLLDYKTSKGIYNEMRYQVSAYLHALTEMKKGKYDGVWILRFDKESGDFFPLYISPKESKKDFEAFLGALAIKRREQELQKNAKRS